VESIIAASVAAPRISRTSKCLVCYLCLAGPHRRAKLTGPEELDEAYPEAKFILCVRDARRWLRSVDAYWHLRRTVAAQ